MLSVVLFAEDLLAGTEGFSGKEMDCGRDDFIGFGEMYLEIVWQEKGGLGMSILLSMDMGILTGLAGIIAVGVLVTLLVGKRGQDGKRRWDMWRSKGSGMLDDYDSENKEIDKWSR